MRKHLLVVLAFVLAGLIAWAQPLNIGGHRAVQDNRNGIWLCSVPQSLFGSDYNATVNYGDSISDFKIDGVEVANGGAYTFAAIAGGKNYPVTFVLNDEVVAGDITFTWLPVVELKGTFGHTYSYGTVTVNEPDSAYAEPLMAKLKWRGTVTNDGAKHKRNYRIKFVNEDSTKQNHRFFGLRNDNSWILDAGQMDFMRVRNRVGTDIWLEMARRPWYSDTLPNARNGSRGQMVEVILNDYYAGIYNMCEPIDRKQLKLKRYDEDTLALPQDSLPSPAPPRRAQRNRYQSVPDSSVPGTSHTPSAHAPPQSRSSPDPPFLAAHRSALFPLQKPRFYAGRC